MPLCHRSASTLVALALFAIGSAHGEIAAAPDAEIARLSWLAGGWGGDAGGTTSEEHWTTAAGDALVGMHKDVAGGKMVSFEFLRIEVDASGKICYLAMPGGAPATAFCAVEVAEHRVVFENLEHDFPQRILYWLDASGSLHARVEGPRGGKEAALEWTWKRLPG